MSLSKILRFSFDDPSFITSLGITLMLMLIGFVYYYFYSNSSSSASKKQKSSSFQKRFKYDVFISFMGEDTCKDFVDRLYDALKDKGIYTYKVGENIQKGKRISDDLFESIEDSKFYIIVFSKNYASSSWCLEELVKIMECHKMTGHTAYPVFYDVEPTEVRKQSGAVGKAFAKHENEEAARKWRAALKKAADLTGLDLNESSNGDESKLIQMVAYNIFEELCSINDGHEDKSFKAIVDEMSPELHSGFDANSVGMVTRVKDVVTPATVLNKLVEAIGSLTAFLGKLWDTYYPMVVKVDLTPGSAFRSIIWCLLVFAGLKSQSVTGFPFKTHPNAIKVPVTSLLIFAFASMAELVVEVARLDHTSVYAIIARLGRIISLCLFVTSLAILIFI